MKILSIITQKPSSTGSGIYLTEILKSYQHLGEEQAVICGVTKEDKLPDIPSVDFFPVYYESEELPYPVLGMSDEMPYNSTRYKDLTEEMLEQFERAFSKKLEEVMSVFSPDLILCHHLYLLTALVREKCPQIPIFAFCHNTDLRQMEKHDLEKERIVRNIQKLDKIFTPKEAQRQEVLRLYGVEPEKVINIGIGYNAEELGLPTGDVVSPHGIPRRREIRSASGEKYAKGEYWDLLFAGKLGEKKGVFSLLRSLEALYQKGRKNFRLFMVGDNGNQEEKEAVYALAKTCSYSIHFLGRLDYSDLIPWYEFSDCFLLPSFFDAVPMTVIESLACGNKVVLTALEGLEDFFTENLPTAPIFFVELPPRKNADEIPEEVLPVFEERLEKQIAQCMDSEYSKMISMGNLSWDGIAEKVLSYLDFL